MKHMLPCSSRMTPVASDSGRISHSGSSDPSHPDDNSANSTWVSTASHPSHPSQQSQYNSTLAVPASVGLCTLATENQLKDSLLGKDRIFLLVLGKEIEGFVASAVNGHQTTATPEATSTSMLAALGPSFVVTAAATSKFQRMLVYKAAEWYGLKAAPGPDGTMIIGVLDSLDEKA